MQTLKVALIGFGNISSHHVKAPQRIGGAAIEVEAIYDAIRENAPVKL